MNRKRYLLEVCRVCIKPGQTSIPQIQTNVRCFKRPRTRGTRWCFTKVAESPLVLATKSGCTEVIEEILKHILNLQSMLTVKVVTFCTWQSSIGRCRCRHIQLRTWECQRGSSKKNHPSWKFHTAHGWCKRYMTVKLQI